MNEKQKSILNKLNAITQKKSFFILLTGLSGAGKSTIAKGVLIMLQKNNIPSFHLDGDVLRNGLNKDLGFSPKDREENLRRLAEIGKLFVDANMLTLASFIAPYKSNRTYIKNIVGAANFIEVFISTPLSVCENRDVKGLYKKARVGEIADFTGIGAPYEVPITPNFTIDTTNITEEKSVEKLFNFILELIKQ